LESPPAGTDSLSQLLPLLLQLLTPSLAGAAKPPVALAPEDPEIADLKKQVADLKQQLKDNNDTKTPAPDPPKDPSKNPPADDKTPNYQADFKSHLNDLTTDGSAQHFIADIRYGNTEAGSADQGISTGDLKRYIDSHTNGTFYEAAKALLNYETKTLGRSVDENTRISVADVQNLGAS
jgi:hypothetical protein